MTIPRWLRWPLYTVLGLAYALVFGEVFVRVMAPQALVPRFVTGAPDGIRANLPGASFRQVTPEVDAQITYNAQGMRAEREYPIAKPAGTCRVALLGDSFFVGFESTFENSFAVQLERLLNERGHRCEVLNFAVSGFGTAESLVALRSRVLKYSPDLLVLSWHRTDPADNRRSNLFTWDGRTLQPTGRPFLPGVKVSDTLMAYAPYRWAVEHSHFYNAVREWIGVTGKNLLLMLSRRPADDDDAPPAAGKPGGGDNGPAADSLDLALLGAVDEEMKRAGGHMLLYEIPDFRSRTSILSSLQVLHPSVYERFAVASPLQAMQARATPEVKFYQEQGQNHWTPLGNRLAAEVAVERIEALGWLPPTR